MNYLRYLFLSSGNKTRYLLAEAHRDAYFAPILDDLEAFGFEIGHSFFEGNGVYQPYAVSVSSEDFREEFLRQHAEGKFKARFRIGSRHGAGAALFHFLHELVHFKQDIEGRIQGGAVADLEIEAAAESICAAYRLKRSGYSMAWRGAMGSINWRGLARAYARDPDIKKLKADIKLKLSSYGVSEKSRLDDHVAGTPPYLWKTFNS